MIYGRIMDKTGANWEIYSELFNSTLAQSTSSELSLANLLSPANIFILLKPQEDGTQSHRLT